MNYINVNLTIRVYWQFKYYPHIKITKCKKLINTKSGNFIPYTKRGFFISGTYYKRNELKNMIEKVKAHQSYSHLLLSM